MKSAIILALLALPVSAQITATFQTTRGNILVTLQYDKTPKAVANFITLAQGTRSTYDATTGAVRPKRFYAGETFHRVLNGLGADPDFKIAQTGTGNAVSPELSGAGPGYKFRDEFHASLSHVPYVLAMANRGPNTQGSQIYFTGSAEIPDLDGRHTVFGLVTDTASRAVIDQIILGGSGTTGITDVTIQRVGAAAIAFNEFSQNLPTCSGVRGSIIVNNPGGFNDVIYQCGVPLPEASVFRVSRSQTLQSWQFSGAFSSPEDLPAGLDIGIDQNLLPARFYNISLTTYPSPMRQGSLANRTLVLSSPVTETITLVFDGSGFGGNLTRSSSPGQNYPFTFDHNAEAYGSILDVFPVLAWPYPLPLSVVCGYDSESPTQVLGRQSTFLSNGGLVSYGTMTLSK